MSVAADIARPSSRRRPHFEITRAEDMGPTPERREKDDYDHLTMRGTRLRERTRQNTVKALYDAGDIGADALNAAQWWYATLAEVQRYTRAVDQEKLAREAMKLFEAVKPKPGIVKPSE